MKTEIEKTKVVSKRVQINTIRMLESHVINSAMNDLIAPPYQFTVKTQTRTEQDKKNKKIIVVLTFDLDVNAGEKSIFKANTTYEGVYSISSFRGLNPSHFEAFGNLNGMYNVWPYFREYIQNITARMGLLSMTLPVFIA